MAIRMARKSSKAQAFCYHVAMKSLPIESRAMESRASSPGHLTAEGETAWTLRLRSGRPARTPVKLGHYPLKLNAVAGQAILVSIHVNQIARGTSSRVPLG